MKIYRSARATDPHLGHLSFWALSRRHAEWFAAWEARTYGLERLGPSRIYQAEIPRDKVLDLSLYHISPETVCKLADRIAKEGFDWNSPEGVPIGLNQ